MKKHVKRLFTAFLLMALSFTPASAANLVKGKNTAVVLYDENPGMEYRSQTVVGGGIGIRDQRLARGISGASQALEIIRGRLISSGYRVVNPKTLASIRKNKAARLALDGNVEAIRRLAGRYGVGQYITGHVTAQRAVKNEFDLYTATAVVSINAYNSGGKYILAESADAKEVGYTPDEAQSKAVSAAAAKIADALCISHTGNRRRGGGMDVVVTGVHSVRDLQSVISVCRRVYGVKRADSDLCRGGSATVTVHGKFDKNELVRALENNLDYATVDGVRGDVIYLFLD